MDERTSRIFIGLCLLALIWIGVYWMWEPTKSEKSAVISFEQPELISSEPANDLHDEPPALISQIQLEATPNELTSSPNDAEPERIVPKLVPPEFFEHVVRDGERMQSIAEEYFGSTSQWHVIARANPFVDPRELRVGMVLRIPRDPQNIQGEVQGRTTEPGIIESHANDPSSVIEYVVRPGDSLSRIAVRIYGSSRYAKHIFESNRDKLRSMDDISVGQLLKLPPLPEESESGS